MHPTQTLIGEAAAVVEVAQSIPYYISILRGHTRPQRASYGIWLVIETVEVASYIASGATTTKWVLIISAFNSLVIFLLSFKYGMGGANKLDIASLSLAAVAIILWITTSKPSFAVYMSVLAGCIGFIPTIRKAYLYPRTENTLSWCMYVAAVGLNVCALTTTRLVIMLPLLITLAFASVLAYLLLFPNWKIQGLKRPNTLL
jgi:hypothetical protein